MTLESAERLVEKILQQLEVRYQTANVPTPAHDGADDGHHDGGERSFIVDAEVLPQLPSEIRPFVAGAQPSEAVATNDPVDEPPPER